MKLKEFIKLANNSTDILNLDLIRKDGGSGCNGNWLWNELFDTVREMIADGEPEENIKNRLNGITTTYEIKSKKLEIKAKTMMKKFGFKMVED